MAVDVDTPTRKVAHGLLDVRPARILAVYGRHRFPYTIEDFERRAHDALSRPCTCRMCRGIPVGRTAKQIENARSDLTHNRFKRAIIFCRDGWRCRDCGAEEELTIDHEVSLGRGGSNAYHNLRVLCVSCHVSRADSHSPRLLARHLANLVDDIFPLIQPTNAADVARVDKVRRLIDNIRAEAVA